MADGTLINWAGRLAVACSVIFAWSVAGWAEGSSGDAAELSDPSPYARSGPYLGLYGAVGISTVLDNHIRVTQFRSGQNQRGRQPFNIDPSVGIGVRAGYRLGPRLAIEGHFEWMNEFDIAFENADRTQPNVSSELGTVESWTGTVNLRAYALTGRVQPYALVGVGVLRFDSVNTSERAPLGSPAGRPIFTLNISDEDGVGFAARLGGGIEMFVTDDVAIVVGASYVLPTGDARHFDYVSTEAGLQVRF